MITIKSLSPEAMCVMEHEMHKLRSPNPMKFKVFNTHGEEIGKADIVTVEVKNLKYETFYVDVDTGSTYDMDTLKCNTGPLELRR